MSTRDFHEAQQSWGALANKFGTLVEDMVAPSFPGVLRRYFGVEAVDEQIVRWPKHHPTDRSRMKIAAALSLSLRLINHLTENGCYAMMLADDIMDIVNFEKVSGLPSAR